MRLLEQMTDSTRPAWSRRRFLTAAGAVALGGVSLGAVLTQLQGTRAKNTSSPDPSASTQPGGRHQFLSRPDLTPPVVTLLPSLGEPSTGLIFFTPGNGAGTDGPLIVDNAGQPIWIRPDANGLGASTFRPISHQGRPALVWWEGGNNNGIGIGEFVLADATYTEIGRVKAVGGSRADHHEFQLTKRGSALIFSDSGVAATRVAGS